MHQHQQQYYGAYPQQQYTNFYPRPGGSAVTSDYGDGAADPSGAAAPPSPAAAAGKKSPDEADVDGGPEPEATTAAVTAGGD